MGEAAGRLLLLPDNVVFTCQNSGACCRSDWLIGVDAASHTRLRDVNWRTVDPALADGEKFVPLKFPLASGEQLTFARNAAGSCVFLTPDARCSIHRHLGAAAKPQVCREFPYHFVETPDGVAVGVSFACTAVRGHHGAQLHEQREAIESPGAWLTTSRTCTTTIAFAISHGLKPPISARTIRRPYILKTDWKWKRANLYPFLIIEYSA